MTLMRDCNLVKALEDPESRIYCEIFHDTFEYHREHQHVYQETKKHAAQLSGLYGGVDFLEPDPWTGIWALEKDKSRIERTAKLAQTHSASSFRSGTIKSPAHSVPNGNEKRGVFRKI